MESKRQRLNKQDITMPRIKTLNAIRLIAEIPAEIHREVKLQAIWRNITMRQFTLMAILEKIKRDKIYE